jgi:hypothetical protein
MISIIISKCHCEFVKEAIWEAIPSARAAGIVVQQAIDLMNDPVLANPDTIRMEIDEDLWKCIQDILKYHPQPEVGNFFIHHLEDLAEDSALGY